MGSGTTIGRSATTRRVPAPLLGPGPEAPIPASAAVTPGTEIGTWTETGASGVDRIPAGTRRRSMMVRMASKMIFGGPNGATTAWTAVSNALLTSPSIRARTVSMTSPGSAASIAPAAYAAATSWSPT